MRVTKYTTKNVMYYECSPVKGIHLFAFTKRALIIDLVKIYGYHIFKPLNLN